MNFQDVNMGLQGSRVVVLGGGGLGAACVNGFVDVGARVAVIDRDPSALDHLAARAGARGPALIAGDAATEAGCEELMDKATAAIGGLDVFVHALGINIRKPFLEFDTGEWESLIRLNLETVFWATRYAGRRMCRTGGRVVLFSSVAGTLGHKNHGPYAASKGAINQLTKVLAHEWADRDVTVNALAPGYVETDLTRGHLQAAGVRAGLEALVPKGRLGAPEEVVGPVLFLCSPLASFITGQIIHVDGGRTLV